MSVSQMLTPTCPCAGVALGAAASHSFSAPASSPSTWLQVVQRNPADRGFVPQPKRWVVEQTFGILSFHRRLVRDYEHRLSSSASRVYWAMTDVMARRLTGASTPSWRPA